MRGVRILAGCALIAAFGALFGPTCAYAQVHAEIQAGTTDDACLVMAVSGTLFGQDEALVAGQEGSDQIWVKNATQDTVFVSLKINLGEGKEFGDAIDPVGYLIESNLGAFETSYEEPDNSWHQALELDPGQTAAITVKASCPVQEGNYLALSEHDVQVQLSCEPVIGQRSYPKTGDIAASVIPFLLGALGLAAFGLWVFRDKRRQD